MGLNSSKDTGNSDTEYITLTQDSLKSLNYASTELDPPPKMIPVVFRWKDDITNPGQVSICGSFNNWQTKMDLIKISDGNFYTIQMLPEGTYEYKFIVDHVWRCDEKKKMIANPYGSCNNVMEVTKTDIEVFEHLAKDLSTLGHFSKEYDGPRGAFTLEEYGEFGYGHGVWLGTKPRKNELRTFSPHLYVEMLCRLKAEVEHNPAFYQEPSLSEYANDTELFQLINDIITSQGPKETQPSDFHKKDESGETLEKSIGTDSHANDETHKKQASSDFPITAASGQDSEGSSPNYSIAIAESSAIPEKTLNEPSSDTESYESPDQAVKSGSPKEPGFGKTSDLASNAIPKEDECMTSPKTPQSDPFKEPESVIIPKKSTSNDTHKDAESGESVENLIQKYYKNYDPNMDTKRTPEVNHLYAHPINIQEPMYAITSTKHYCNKTIAQVCYQDVDPRYKKPSLYFK